MDADDPWDGDDGNELEAALRGTPPEKALAGQGLDETPRVRSMVLEVPDWPGHRAGQHVDVRLTAEAGNQAQRSYSMASAPEDPRLARPTRPGRSTSFRGAGVVLRCPHCDNALVKIVKEDTRVGSASRESARCGSPSSPRVALVLAEVNPAFGTRRFRSRAAQSMATSRTRPTESLDSAGCD